MPLPQEMAPLLNNAVYAQMACTNLWRELTRSQIVSFLEAVRNRVLNLAIDIEEKFPDIEGRAATDSEREVALGQTFNTNIFGDGNIVAASGRDTHQIIDNKSLVGNMEELTRSLSSKGVPAEDISELKKILTDEPAPKDMQHVGEKAAAWIGKMVSKAATGSWQIAAGAAGGLLTRVLATYWGL